MKKIPYVFLAIVLAMGTSGVDAVDRNEIAIWSANGDHGRVVRELDKHAWNASSDPQLLVTYCGSWFATKVDVLDCVIGPESAVEAKQFASALWDVWSGQTRKARGVFEALVAIKDWSEWGHTGLLELAWYTENTRTLEKLLSALEKSPSTSRSKAFTEIVDRYRLCLAEADADWGRVREIVGRYPVGRITSSPFLFSAYAHALFVEGKKNELGDLLKAGSPVLQKTTDYMFREAEYALLIGRVGDSVNAIQRYAEKHPDNDALLLQKAYLEILNSSPEVANAATAQVYEIAKSSRSQVRLIFEIATSLASVRKPDESEEVLRLLDGKHIDADEFAMYHTLYAWYAVYSGDTSEAKKRVASALALAPKQVSANRLKALLAKKLGDPEAGAEALEILFGKDPYNENYASLILHFRDRFRTAGFEKLFEMVASQQMYYADAMRKRIREGGSDQDKEGQTRPK